MVRGRINNRTRDRFKRAIQDVLKGLSRRILIYKQPIKSQCPNCYFDKLTGRSTGKCKWTVEEAATKQAEWIAVHPGEVHYKYFYAGRCPICRGEGLLITKRKAWADCVVIWNPSSNFDNTTTYTPAGTEGSTVVQLKTHPKYFDLFKNCDKIVVDGVDCKLSRPPVMRGLGNESVLVIEAFSTDKPKVDRSEILKDYS